MTERVTVTRHEGDSDRYIVIPLLDNDGDRSDLAASFAGTAPTVVAGDTEITDTSWAGESYVSGFTVNRNLRVPVVALSTGEHQLERAVISGENDVDLSHITVRIV